MIETLKALCALNGVTGNEGPVREYIRSRIEPYADEVKEDAMGCLLAFRKGSGSSDRTLMLAAHMDEVGVIVTHVEEDGYLRFACAGGIDRRVFLGKELYLGEDGVRGVIGSSPLYVTPAGEREKTPPVDDMYIDIGAGSRDEALRYVRPGDTGAFSPEIYEFGNGMLKAKAIDDRVGCAVLIKLIEKQPPVDTWYVFTVQEEVGCRGAQAAAFRIRPDAALIVEGTTAADLPSVRGNKKVCRSGAGAVIPFMDKGTISDRELFGRMTALAERKGIPWQTKSMIAGGTDARSIQRSAEGVRVVGIAAAVRNIHSPGSAVAVSDVLNVYELASAFVGETGEWLI